MSKMNILVACEESQEVTKELRKLGHRAFSCDLFDQSGGHPEWHIKGDALALINGFCRFKTTDGKRHVQNRKWDMIIAFPPCTYLTSCGNRWFNIERYGEKALLRYKQRDEGAEFFMKFVNADCDKIVIENPVGCMSNRYRKPDQIINPYQFGEPFQKKTCLWLKGVSKLVPTKIVDIPPRTVYKSGKTCATWFADAAKYPNERAKIRSKTFHGIAVAMAKQFTA